MFNEQFCFEISRYVYMFYFWTRKCILKINYRNSSKLMKREKEMLWKIISILFSLFHIKKARDLPLYKVYGCGHSLQHFIPRTYFPWYINFNAWEWSCKPYNMVQSIPCKFWRWRQNSLLIPLFYSETDMHVS